MQRDRWARWLRVILLCAAVLVSGLGIGELGNAATSLSVLVDPAYDGGPAPYLDIRSARVVQLDTDLLQFEMTLGGPPLRDTDPDHFLTCIWFVDTDENASTGQLHSGIGSDYNLRANLREHWFHGQAFIDPIPPVGAAWPAGTVGVQHVEEATATVRMVVRREQIGMLPVVMRSVLPRLLRRSDRSCRGGGGGV